MAIYSSIEIIYGADGGGKSRRGWGEVRKQRSKEVMMERRRKKERKKITQRRRGHRGALRRVGKVFES
jgi:hypothetical protein